MITGSGVRTRITFSCNQALKHTKNYDQCQCQHRLVNQLLNTDILLQIYMCYDNFETLIKSGGQVGIELRSQKIFCERKYLEVFF